MKSHQVTESDLLESDTAETAETWNEETPSEEAARPKACAASGKWRSIEEYWERRRLRDQIHDVFEDE